MLILTRRIGESIIINDNIMITILGVRGLQVRVGIDAPRDISVHREEIYNRILEEREAGGDFSQVKLKTNQHESLFCPDCLINLPEGVHKCPACGKAVLPRISKEENL